MPDKRMQATAGTPRPWTFRLSRQVSWLAGRSFLPVFPTREGISDAIRKQLAAYSCGGSAGIPRQNAVHRLPS